MGKAWASMEARRWSELLSRFECEEAGRPASGSDRFTFTALAHGRLLLASPGGEVELSTTAEAAGRGAAPLREVIRWVEQLDPDLMVAISTTSELVEPMKVRRAALLEAGDWSVPLGSLPGQAPEPDDLPEVAEGGFTLGVVQSEALLRALSDVDLVAARSGGSAMLGKRMVRLDWTSSDVHVLTHDWHNLALTSLDVEDGPSEPVTTYVSHEDATLLAHALGTSAVRIRVDGKGFMIFTGDGVRVRIARRHSPDHPDVDPVLHGWSTQVRVDVDELRTQIKNCAIALQSKALSYYIIALTMRDGELLVEPSIPFGMDVTTPSAPVAISKDISFAARYGLEPMQWMVDRMGEGAVDVRFSDPQRPLHLSADNHAYLIMPVSEPYPGSDFTRKAAHW